MPPLDIPLATPDHQVWRSWLALADALMVQRFYLHRAESAEILGQAAALPDIDLADARALVTVPEYELIDAELADISGLTAFFAIPRRSAHREALSHPLWEAAVTQAAKLLRSEHLSVSVPEMAAAAAWWVGFFATIRHRGVHHRTLEPVTSTVGLDTLREAARVVALGTALRVIEASLRTSPAVDADAERAYCAAITGSIKIEPRLPALLEDLAELRLVDLVSLAVPWRGRFTKYAGGTGAGQVE